MDSSLQQTTYLKASAAVRHRLARVRFASGIRRSHFFAGTAVVILILVLRLAGQWRGGEWIVAGGILVLWLAGVGIFARVKLPGTAAALMLLDRKGGWKDRFSSAWEFLNRSTRTEAQNLHLHKSGELIESAVESIPAVFPIPSLHRSWISPLLSLAFALSPWFRVPPDSRDFQLTDGMKDTAALKAEEFKRAANRIGEFDAMTEEERKALHALGIEVEELANLLANPNGLTAGEMLEVLDAKAGAAGKLAQSLERYRDEWASAEMLEEMGRHADTADLSLLIEDKAAMAAADEAMRLKEIFDDPEIKADTEGRLTRSLESIMKASLEVDLKRPVGERFGNASVKMQNAQTKTAAREFEELAKHFREMAGREKTIRELEKLAENLREAGGEISGSELQKMEQIADTTTSGEQSTNEGLRPLDSNPGGNVNSGEMPGFSVPGAGQEPKSSPDLAGSSPGQVASEKKVPVPGSSTGEGTEGGRDDDGQESFSAPIPGEESRDGKSGSGLGMSDQTRDGEGSGGGLSAPVPGMDPGEASPGAGLSAAAGSSAQTGQGGDQAGSGTAELVEQDSEVIKASGDAEVIAQTNQSGDSVVRSIEGEARTERAGRSVQEVVTEFIAVEEQALDDQSLPMSRKQHVLRYFSGIRQQFEDGKGE